MAYMKAPDNKNKRSQQPASASPSIKSSSGSGALATGNEWNPGTFLRLQQTMGNKATIQMLSRSIAQMTPETLERSDASQSVPAAAPPQAPASVAPQALPVTPEERASASQGVPAAAPPQAPAAGIPAALPAPMKRAAASRDLLNAQAPAAPAAPAPPAHMQDRNFKHLAFAGEQLGRRKERGEWGAGAEFEAESAAGDTLNDALESASSGTGGKSDVLDARIKPLEDLEDDQSKNQKAGLEKDKADIDLASAAMGTLSGFIGLAGMRKAWKEAGSDRAKKGAVLYEGLENATKTFSGIAGVIDNSAKSRGMEDGIGKSDAVAGWSGSIGDALAAIKSAYESVKGIYGLITAAEGDLSSKDKAMVAISSINNALQAAQSTIKTIKQIREIFDMGTAGLAKAIPGIGIAISGVKIILKAFTVFEAYHSKNKMAVEKKEAKDKLEAQGFVKERTFSLFGKVLFSSKVTDKQKVQARKEELLSKGVLSEEDAAEVENIEQYELSREMKNINQKRINRGVTEIGLELLSIAGDIATLSGAGASAGIPLKAAAAAAGTAMSVGRRIKQMGRDRAAQDDAWGITKAVFNADKSSEAKHKKRVKDTERILDMIANLPEPIEDENVRKQYERVENYLMASGCNPAELYQHNGDIDKQREIMIEAMKRRD